MIIAKAIQSYLSIWWYPHPFSLAKSNSWPKSTVRLSQSRLRPSPRLPSVPSHLPRFLQRLLRRFADLGWRTDAFPGDLAQKKVSHGFSSLVYRTMHDDANCLCCFFSGKLLKKKAYVGRLVNNKPQCCPSPKKKTNGSKWFRIGYDEAVGVNPTQVSDVNLKVGLYHASSFMICIL